MTKKDVARLEARIAQNCSEFTGLTRAQMRDHKRLIVNVVVKAKTPRAAA